MGKMGDILKPYSEEFYQRWLKDTPGMPRKGSRKPQDQRSEAGGTKGTTPRKIVPPEGSN